MNEEQPVGSPSPPDSSNRNTKPLKPARPATGTWKERLADRRIFGLLIALTLFSFLLAAMGGWLLLRMRTAASVLPEPNITITPPASLAELVTQFPELAPILQDAELDSAYKDFILAYQQGGPDAALELARNRGLINDNNELIITLELDTSDTAVIVAQLQAQGIRVTAAIDNLLDIAVPMALIEQAMQAGDPSMLFRSISELEHVIRIRLPRVNIQHYLVDRPHPKDFYFEKEKLFKNLSLWVKSGPFDLANLLAPPASNTALESLSRINAPAWHEAGFTGQGVKIGILDMGFKNYKNFLGSELPANVTARSFISGVEIDQTESPHGTACAEIIYDIAPQAELFFAAYRTDVEQRRAVSWLVSEGVHIISHSAGSIYGPMDGTGAEARMVDDIVAGGVLWVNSSGNMAENHYHGVFIDEDDDDFHEFRRGDEMMSITPISGERVVISLNWDDWTGGTEDYDLYILDKDSNEIVSSKNIQDGPGNDSAEFIAYRFPGRGPYYLSIRARQITRPATFDLYIYNVERMEYVNAEYSVTTPADSNSSFAVGAVYWNNDSLESYSSQGPTNDGRLKPDISAPSGVRSVVYGKKFYGTSASAPHVSGASALVWSALAQQGLDPLAIVPQIKEHLRTQSKDLGTRGPDMEFGHGRLWLGEPNIRPSGLSLPTETQTAPGVPTATTGFELPTIPPVFLPPLLETATDAPPSPTAPRSSPSPVGSTTPVAIAPIATPTPAPEKTEINTALLTLGLLGCVGIPGFLGVGGIVVVWLVWSAQRNRKSGSPRRVPAAPDNAGGYSSSAGGQGRLAPNAHRLGNQPQAGAPRPDLASALQDAAPIQCGRCGAALRSQARFCNVCGNDLALSAASAAAGQVGKRVFCTACGTALRPTSKFCPACGKPRRPRP